MTTMHIEMEGDNAAEVVRYVGKRLVELGYAITQPTDQTLELEMNPETPALVDSMRWRISPHDPVDFAGEKVLDDLETEGAISLKQADLPEEDEEAIRQRLQDLGYIE